MAHAPCGPGPGVSAGSCREYFGQDRSFLKTELPRSFPAALWPSPLTMYTVLVPDMSPASAQAPERPLRLRTGVESQPLSSMLHRGGDMAMQGLTFRTPSAALWLDLHQTKRAMDDPYDVLRPLMLDSMASRPNFDLGLAADTSRETGQGHGVQGRSA